MKSSRCMHDDAPLFKRYGNDELTVAFILRLTWEREARAWRILLKPVRGGDTKVFTDVESAFLYVAGLLEVID